MIGLKMLFAAFTILSLFALPVVTYRPGSSGYSRNGVQISGTVGVDVSELVSVDSFQCMKDLGVQFVIVRAYRSIGQPDSNAPQTIANARAAGISYVDVYMFPCPTCSTSAGEQVREMVNTLSGSNYGQIWLDVERHKTTGVYTKTSDWTPIMGSGYTGGSGHQLWWPRYDGNLSFSGFSAFGGWSSPAIKQYEANTLLCSVNFDKNWCDAAKPEQLNVLLLVLGVAMAMAILH